MTSRHQRDMEQKVAERVDAYKKRFTPTMAEGWMELSNGLQYTLHGEDVFDTLESLVRNRKVFVTIYPDGAVEIDADKIELWNDVPVGVSQHWIHRLERRMKIVTTADIPKEIPANFSVHFRTDDPVEPTKDTEEGLAAALEDAERRRLEGMKVALDSAAICRVSGHTWRIEDVGDIVCTRCMAAGVVVPVEAAVKLGST